MNAKQRYDKKHPIISFRVDQEFMKIIDQHVLTLGYKNRQKLMHEIINDYFEKNELIKIRYDYLGK